MILGNREHKKYFGGAGGRFYFHFDFWLESGKNDAFFIHCINTCREHIRCDLWALTYIQTNRSLFQ